MARDQHVKRDAHNFSETAFNQNPIGSMQESVKELYQPIPDPQDKHSIHRIAARVSIILGFRVLADIRSKSTIARLSIMGSMVLTGMLSCAS